MATKRQRFERLACPQLDGLYRTARRLADSEDDARDIVQEACLKAYTAFDETNEPRQFRPWLFRILVNAALDGRRHRKRRHGATGSVDDVALAVADPGLAAAPHRLAEAREIGTAIERALAGLTPDLRTVVLLVLVEEMAYAEAAAALAISEDLVRSRLARARALLRNLLRDAIEVRPTSTSSGVALHVRHEQKRGSE